MKRGLITGKFMPVHKGHIALIDFALDHCDELIVLVSASYDEPIPGSQRLEWITELYKDNHKVKPWLLNYDEVVVPGVSESSDNLTRIWANYLQQQLPPIDVIFASEAYGAYMSRFLNCESMIYSEPCKIVPVAATQIMKDPAGYWDYLPGIVQEYFSKEK
ncbi:adenylyltransferase/cytidyltransferase family protein [Mucilaginibacter sabulilitoris]|uniref:Adenylyltransferase/cytidyltransferase family protein n=1 Tax=Mucilaginibacter sabulilitoris TaxID=1173583 RepID=A0ABZ0TQG9_9SPHI|nr:adenylyltransferase/cytidyltransferase family protein [Mucilaginibacter sabulilitoris]WPU95139.1 adenylyltransferase/cytidyltransferase family protein [Mucilaginibacter sabulilitoris]